MDAATAVKGTESKRGALEQRLWGAVEKQDASEARRLLQKLARGSWLGAKSTALQPALHKGRVTSHLHVAALSGLVDICRLLLASRAHVDARDHAGFTPLLCAASQRHWQCCAALLEHGGANATLVNSANTSILHLLAVPGEPGDLPLQLQLMASCIRSGCNVNARDCNGDTPLILAASRNQANICTFLLENGAKVNQVNNFGETALHKAAMSDFLHLALLVLEMGADPLIVSKNGTPRELLGASGAEERPLLHSLLTDREASWVDTTAIELGDYETEALPTLSAPPPTTSSPLATRRRKSSVSTDGSRSPGLGLLLRRRSSASSEGSARSSSAARSPAHVPDSGDASPQRTLGAASRWASQHFGYTPAKSTVQLQDEETTAGKRKGSSLPFLSASVPVELFPAPGGDDAAVPLDAASISSRSSRSTSADSLGGDGLRTAQHQSQPRTRLLELRSELTARLEALKHGQSQLNEELDSVQRALTDLADGATCHEEEASGHSSGNCLRVPRNTPSVQRVLRQPSDGGVELMTVDAAYRQELSGFGQLDDLTVGKPEFPYLFHFWRREHSVFLSAAGVACVLHAEAQGSHLVLALDSRGYSQRHIPALQLLGKDFCESCLSWLSVNLWPEADCLWAVDSEALKVELLELERNASEKSNRFRVGVVYAKSGDGSEAEMFQNPMTERFADFLDLFSDQVELEGWTGYRGQLSVTAPGTSYYASWRSNEIMFHVAPLLDAEQQRRLIGNDTVVVYFHDATSTEDVFSSATPRSTMNQVFVIVRPVKGGRKLKVGFMARKNVAEFGPTMPMNPTFDVTTSVGRALFKEFLLCRIINGSRAAMSSPPLEQMLRRPRIVALERLVQEYPIGTARRKGILRKKP